MCTSIISNRKKTIVGWNLDILNMVHRVTVTDTGIFIEISDPKEGWLPLFGANSRGDFVGMPTCWPHDAKSDPKGGEHNIIMLDIDLLMQKKTLQKVKDIAEKESVCSIPGVTFMAALSDREGNMLHIVPGQGVSYYEKPKYRIMTNFSPFKTDPELHPWTGLDRYRCAEKMLEAADDDFDVSDCFEVLKAVSQTVCPTVVSMVCDVTERKVFWCENRNYEAVSSKEF